MIATDSVVFSRVAAGGSGDNAAAAELGAGIGNLIRASGDRRRADKLCEEALTAIRADFNDSGTMRVALPEKHPSEETLSDPQQVASPAHTDVPSSGPPLPQASLIIESTPPGADIEIDGAFVGNTPSTVLAAPGSHQIAVKKKGLTDWTKTLSVTGGTVHLNADLDQQPAK